MFYYEKMVGSMPSSFADLVFVGERIEVGLRRGKFDYAASTSAGNRRTGTEWLAFSSSTCTTLGGA